MNTNKTFSDYLYVLYKWKKFILINLFILVAAATIYSFLIPETFKATAKITLSQQNNMNDIGNLLSNDNPLVSLGSQFLGMNSTGQTIILGLLNSRTILTAVIKKFDLIKYYDIKENNIDKALKAFEDDISFDQDENGLIVIDAINKDPKVAAEIANYFVALTDSMNIELNIEQAKNNKEFIAKRYEKNVKDLQTAEDSMYKFQKKYGIYAIPEQLVSAFQAAGDLESELFKQEITAEYSRNQYGVNSEQFKSLTNQIEFIKNKINELKNAKTLSYPTNILVPFEKLPKMIEEYFRYYREIDIQTKIMEFILPMYEQAKVEEQKSIPTLLVIDSAVPPQLKYAPKKLFIIIIIFLLALFFIIPLVFWAESIMAAESNINPLLEKEKHFIKKIVHFYRIKYYHE